MNRTQLIIRRSELMDVHAWCYENEMILSELQLVCVSKEIASILHVFDWLKTDSEKHITLEYSIPPELEKKVQLVLQKIKETNWERGEYFFDEYEKKYKRKKDYRW